MSIFQSEGSREEVGPVQMLGANLTISCLQEAVRVPRSIVRRHLGFRLAGVWL